VRRRGSVGQHRRQDAADDPAKLGERLLGGVLRALENFLGDGRVTRQRATRRTDQNGDRHDPVLRPVVQRPFDAPQFGGVRVQRGGAGRGELRDRSARSVPGSGARKSPTGPCLQPRHTGGPSRR